MTLNSPAPTPRVGVGAVVFNDARVLLVKRGTPPSEGLWAIPGGRLELGESLQQAAEREILEETGVVIRAGSPVFTFDVIERNASGEIRFHYVIVDLAAEYISGEPIPDDDAHEARWISEGELSDLDVSDKTLELLREIFHFGKE
ncbi:MAG: NUDIX hydrolase [Bacteroidetes bacterium]|nr:NUDIX hydrolase [Bacteroidota bacterium]MCW5895936.1 NUDIX hydrolase [Bacteroidota bacterium]